MHPLRMKSFFPFALFSIMLLTFSCTNNDQVKNTDSTSELNESTQSTIDSPFEDMTFDYNEYLTIDNPTVDAFFVLESGTAIEIPANIFVDEEGNPVTTPVTLTFEEYHTAAEIIMSGIPMHVNMEDGSKEYMQTAGMFDIRGYDANDQPVQIAEGKNLMVHLSNSDVAGDYDEWFFDQDLGNWINEGDANSPAEVPSVTDRLETEIEDLRASTMREPIPTWGDERDNLVFSDLDMTACPELKDRKSIVLNYFGNDAKKAPRNNKWIANQGLWVKKMLKPTQQEGVYELTMVGDSLYRVEVKEALQGVDLEAAKAEYQASIDEYRSDIKLLAQKEAFREANAKVLRTMRVGSFGLFNYDLLWKRQDAVQIFANFDFGDMPDLVDELVNVYLITGQGRAIVNLPSYDWNKFRFSPSADNCMIAVLPNNKVAIYSQSDFNRDADEIQSAIGQEYTFQMDVQDLAIEKPEDLEKVIEIASL
ncbi:MAG: hypothetical protein AAFO07_08085 [Bacteroidota bacterium]